MKLTNATYSACVDGDGAALPWYSTEHTCSYISSFEPNTI